jgi:1-aminocyclopropane-1-carboxylate deaminase/D-cysteine desulfhydrase-like pyridoxal-dependent ACC family enzyme
LGIEYTRNGVFDGAVVKSNGPANRDIRHFIRNPNTGLLEDRSADIRSLAMSTTVRQRLEHITEFVRMRENEGRAVSHGGKMMAYIHAVHESNSGEPCVIFLKSAGSESTIKAAITAATSAGLIRKHADTGGSEKWLGTMDGPLARGEYERQTGRDNI